MRFGSKQPPHPHITRPKQLPPPLTLDLRLRSQSAILSSANSLLGQSKLHLPALTSTGVRRLPRFLKGLASLLDQSFYVVAYADDPWAPPVFDPTSDAAEPPIDAAAVPTFEFKVLDRGFRNTEFHPWMGGAR